MQKLDKRNTYTPASAAPPRGYVAGQLNSSERVGTVPPSLKTSSNNSEEHLLVWQLQDKRVMLHSSERPPYNSQEETTIYETNSKKLTLPERAKGIIQEVCAIPPCPLKRDILARF